MFVPIQDFIRSLVRLHPRSSYSCLRFSRRINQYQFRIQKPVYYPNRSTEMRRADAVPTSIVQPVEQPKGLPKDYYYKVLGVHRHATVTQIRSAFYSLAKRYHPDSSKSQQKLKHFQELSNAYNILTDETKRLEYDQLGGIRDEQAFLEQAQNPMKVDNKSDQKRDVKVPQKDDVNSVSSNDIELPLTFLEATLGCKKRLQLRYLSKCDSCKGKSQLMANREIGREPCRRCNGTGKVTTKTATYMSVSTCTHCRGRRYINRNDCETCENRGYILANVEVLVTVPSASKAGDVVAIANPHTKERVYYHVKVPTNDYFHRDGLNIYTEKYLSISEAILGGSFQVRGLYENLDIRVDAGTQSHTQLVLPNKGVRSQEGIGNHIVTLKVRIPRNLSMKQRQLVLALAQAEEPVFERSK